MSYAKDYFALQEEITKILYDIGAIQDKPEEDGDKFITIRHDTYKYEREEIVALVIKKLPDNDEESIEEIVNKIMNDAR